MFSLCVHEPVNSIEKIQWNYIFACWGFDQIYILSKNKNKENDNWHLSFSMRGKNVQYIKSLSDIKNKIVYLTPKGNILLNSYNHPKECCYVFGPNNSSMTFNPEGDKVFIDTYRQLYSWVCAGITIYDRLNKNGH